MLINTEDCYNQKPFLKKYKYFFLIFCVFISGESISQNNLKIFPSDLLIQPFTSNTLKPKLGFEFKSSINELSLNIGSSIDILHYNLNGNTNLSLGADLFTYTLLRSQSNFHFPVDAVDYLFGFNFGYKRLLVNKEFGVRLRISHISAHFVDGHYSKEKGAWRDGRDPIVYSREFLELIPYIRFDNLRIYAGFTYIFSIDPPDIGTDQYQFGFDYFADDLISSKLTPYIAYDFRLINIYEYTGNNSLEMGLKFGHPYKRGISLYFRYFSGYNIHGEYFDVKESFTSFGFNIDL